MAVIAGHFGTFRGFVRLVLAEADTRLGRAPICMRNAARARRIVFVCQGNICRSAFAEVVARYAGLNAASFGLSTQTGKPAHAPAIAAAAQLGHDLANHRTTRVEDFCSDSGDLLLAMEVRQLRRLAQRAELGCLPRSLLGLYTQPRYPHLHDPYSLSDAYMRTCLARIATAVARLKASFPNAVAVD